MDNIERTPLTIVPMMMASSQEGSPRRPGIVIIAWKQQEPSQLQDRGVPEAEIREDINNSPSRRRNPLDQQPTAVEGEVLELDL